MAEKKKTGRSNTEQAKRAIRQEIRACFAPSVRGGRSTLENMRESADSASRNVPGNRRSYYSDAERLVDGAYMSIATQADMLNKIYGAEKVAQWDGEKRHEVYRHLIAREYDQMMRDDRKKKEGKLLAKAKATEAKRRKAYPEDLLKVGGSLETEKGIVHLVRQDGKYKVLQQPYEVWQGKRYPSSRGWKVLKSGTLGECQKAVNAAAGVKTPAKKKPTAKQTARKRTTAKKR